MTGSGSARDNKAPLLLVGGLVLFGLVVAAALPRLTGSPRTVGAVALSSGAATAVDAGQEEILQAGDVINSMVGHCQRGRFDLAAECFDGNPTQWPTIQAYLAAEGQSLAKLGNGKSKKVDEDTFHLQLVNRRGEDRITFVVSLAKKKIVGVVDWKE